jgi:hypothetical protein
VTCSSSPSDVTHVGIYIGANRMIDAPHTGALLRVEDYRWLGYVGATRAVDAVDALQRPTRDPFCGPAGPSWVPRLR